MIKVLYLFNRTKSESVKNVEHGVESDNHFSGMFRLNNFGVSAEHMELEQSFFAPLAPFLRKHLLNIHFAHIPLFFRIFKYDIVFTSTAFGTLLLKTLLFLKKPKWVMFDFNIEGMIGDRKKLRQRLFYRMVSKCDGIVTLSYSAAETMRRMFPLKAKNIKFIPLGTDLSFFKPLTDPEEDFIFSPGRDPGRDHKTFLKAVTDLPITVKVTAKTEHLKKAGALPTNVQQCDFSHVELCNQYARAKIIIIPLDISDTSNDAMGCSTLVEAMAMGKAIIATNTPTMRSYITSGVNGILVPPHDADALRKAIEALLVDSEKRKSLGLTARAFMEEHCGADDFAQKLASFFTIVHNTH